jgi:penicillin-binding protein 2
MSPLSEERVGPMTPQLAARVAIAGTFALAMFAIIFFRLWFLQVLTGDQYAKAAQVNSTRYVAIAAPRGQILDASGTPMVDSVPANAVRLVPTDLPVPVTPTNILRQPAKDVALYNRLAKVLQLSGRPAACKVDVSTTTGIVVVTRRLGPIPCAVAQQVALEPYGEVTVKTGVPTQVYAYIAERQNRFPGVTVGTVYVQQYPLGTQAAQVLGTVGPISQAEYNDKHRYRGVSQQAVVGQSGLEWEYDQYLRGVDGYQKVKVNSYGQFEGDGPTQPPVVGDNLRTSLHVGLQETGAAALTRSLQTNTGSLADGGAFVAMNPDNGEVYAMGSLPSFNPGIFTQQFLPQAEYNQLTNPASGYPLINRAIQSAGPTGSTFKPITATAALESGVWTAGDTFDDTGQFCFSGECRNNAGHAVDGVLNLERAIQVSSDDFFYHLGVMTDDPSPQGGALQSWAKKFGIGHPTGVDLPAEVPGTRPTPAWRSHQNQVEAECEKATGPFKGHPKHPASQGGCGIAITPAESWTVGDNENMAVGQGDVQVTPLQLAVVYSALANGGSIVTPHIGAEIETADGAVVQRLTAPPPRNININPFYLETIRAGLRAAASQPGGTSYDVMGNFPQQVYGKTGTAQYLYPNGVEQDYSWYACFVPSSATSKPIVVVVWVEKGGFGDVAAAPVARELLSDWFYGRPGPYIGGSSATL